MTPVRRVTPRSPLEQRAALLLVVPAVLLELIVHVVPILLGVWIGLLDLGPSHLADWTSAPVVGGENYRRALDREGPWAADIAASAVRTATYAVLVVSASWLLGLVAALLLHEPFRGRVLWQGLFLLPFVLPSYVAVLAWRFLLDRDAGALNRLLVDDLGVIADRPFWLLGEQAFLATVLVGTWRLWPLVYLVLAAALRTVPPEVDAAARLDGATAWQRLRWVRLPLIRRASVVVVLMTFLWTATDVSTPFLLFGDQPPRQATLLGNLVYRYAFVDVDLGLAAAVNTLLATTVLVGAGVTTWLLLWRRQVDV